MRCIGWGRLQRQADRSGDLIIPDPPRGAGTRLVIKPIEPALGKPPAPFADRVRVRPKRPGNDLVLAAIRSRKHDPRPPCQTLRGPPETRGKPLPV